MRGIVRRVIGATAILVAGHPASAAEHVVVMQNYAFEPNMLNIAPGDSVRFVPAQPGHNAQSIAGMLPTGAEPIAVPFGVETVVTFIVEGIYGYKCTPHYGMGMVGIIEVGAPVNESAAKAVTHPGLAADVFTELLGSH